MIIKTVILGLLSATAAGSVMYFGTITESDESKEHPHGKAKASETIKDTISKRLPSLRDTIKDKRVERGPSVSSLEEQSKEADGPEVEDVKSTAKANEIEQIGPEAEAETPKKRWLDQYLKNQKKDKSLSDSTDDPALSLSDSLSEDPPVKVELFEEVEPEIDTKPSDKATSTNIIDTDLLDESDGDQTSPAASLNSILSKRKKDEASKTPRYFKIENGVLVEVEDLPIDAAISMDDIITQPSELVTTVMREAAEINKSELRDQAYFEIVEYALSQGDFASAEMALSDIEQVEMAYTAKSRMAVSFAQKGMSGMAFKLIDSVDEVELRDFMRLQVIEAMIAPQKLPAMWQETPPPSN